MQSCLDLPKGTYVDDGGVEVRTLDFHIGSGPAQER